MKVLQRALICLTGKQPLKFLQGIATQNCSKVQEGIASPTCFLDNKARVVFTALIAKLNQQQVLLDIDKSSTQSAVKYLAKFNIKAGLKINTRQDLVVSIDPPNNQLASFQDGRSSLFSKRYYFQPKSQHQQQGQLYSHLCSQQTIVGSNPLFHNLDYYNYIAFNKGCYIGQQIISRAHFVGLVRKRVFTLKPQMGVWDAAVAVGAQVTRDGLPIGTVLESSAYVKAMLKFDLDNLKSPVHVGQQKAVVQLHPQFVQFLQGQSKRAQKIQSIAQTLE